MKKKNVILISLLVVVAVALLVVYLVLGRRKPGSGNPEQPNYFTICKLDTGRIDRLELQTERFEGSFLFNGEMWVREDEEAFPVKQAAVSSMVSVILSNLNAFEKMQNPSAPAEYGLDAKAARLRAFAGGELLAEIIVGNKLPTQNRYYMQLAGDESIYIVSDNYYNYLVKERSDFLENVKLPTAPNNDSVREIKVSGKNIQTVHAVYDENSPYDYSPLNLFKWYFLEPFKSHVNANFQSDTWYSSLTKYTGIAYKKLVVFRPVSYAKYGLEEPEATLYLRYADASGRDNNEIEFYFGNQAEEGGTYARVKGMDWVFLMDTDTVNNLLDVDWRSNYYQTVFFPAMNTFDSVTIKTPNEEWDLVNLHENEEHAAYTLNGRRLTSDELSTINNQFLQLKYSGICKEEDVPGDEIMSIAIKVRASYQKADLTVRFFSFSDSVYLISVDGCNDFIMDVRDVNSFLTFMRSVSAQAE